MKLSTLAYGAIKVRWQWSKQRWVKSLRMKNRGIYMGSWLSIPSSHFVFLKGPEFAYDFLMIILCFFRFFSIGQNRNPPRLKWCHPSACLGPSWQGRWWGDVNAASWAKRLWISPANKNGFEPPEMQHMTGFHQPNMEYSMSFDVAHLSIKTCKGIWK